MHRGIRLLPTTRENAEEIKRFGEETLEVVSGP